MKHIGTLSRLSCLVLLVFLVSLSEVQSQGQLTDVSQLKKEVSDLRNEIQRLTNLMLQMRKVVLESTIAAQEREDKKAPSQEQEMVKKEPPVDEAQLTKTICRAVGIFFSEAEAALRMSDPSAAELGMRQAQHKLTSTLQGYTRTRRVSKLLDIYEGLAWDTYTAVRLRPSIEGDQTFIETLQKHKQKYLETCPRD
jgi:hypothetical protein